MMSNKTLTERKMKDGWSATLVALNPSDKANGGTGGSKEHPQAFGTVVYGDNAYLVYELTRIANALERIAPYFEERSEDEESTERID